MKGLDKETIDSALNNKALMKVAKTPKGQQMLLKQAIKMLKKQRPDLTEEQLCELEEAALTGGLEALDKKLIEFDIVK